MVARQRFELGFEKGKGIGDGIGQDGMRGQSQSCL